MEITFNGKNTFFSFDFIFFFAVIKYYSLKINCKRKVELWLPYKSPLSKTLKLFWLPQFDEKILNRKTKIKENAYLAILIHSENVCWLIFPGLTSACMLINLKNDKKKLWWYEKMCSPKLIMKIWQRIDIYRMKKCNLIILLYTIYRKTLV